MAIDLAKVSVVELTPDERIEEAPASGAPPFVGGINIKDANLASPRGVNVSVEKMEPTAAAGVLLAKIVLAIMSAAIAILSLYLFVMDIYGSAEIGGLYNRILNPDRIGSELYMSGRIDKAIADMRIFEKDGKAPLSDEASKNVKAVIKLVDKLQSVPASQKNSIRQCDAPPPDVSRGASVKSCVAAMESLRDAAVEASMGPANAQIVADYAAKLSEQRQSFHNFWIQAAQLILLNLLLPLLTALFGYVFGTQRNNANGQRS
ncbi:MAG: hypothetical protein C3F11_15750 [Methylocystaceae bacterium]|nr:MAG: hypothetical protein C3F11_15750 [Methylocystaceae bacterium]